ncbi:flagellar basal-body rod protein FlgB [Natronobacillus azotifigens]|uniref:Flagellar basal body rod protein FlgB n=1 Tax=Natronobacillus azotifigens TaxID=472978 RepID=A0A9J6RB56_9BACI|nr:flagellar basal body rod protein FlgB [Natronobacillus azotifigens]MCZ0702556.1 flagellar basal body rod protein FlgB [Natronobacillus azotifigens]
MSLFGSSITNLQHGLNYAALKNQTISNNIANVDTANYKAQNVQFKKILNQEMNDGFKAQRTHERHLDFGSGSARDFRITTNRNTQYNHNGNNVDIDKQMTELANNQIYYQALIERLNGNFNTLQTVIRGGR